MTGVLLAIGLMALAVKVIIKKIRKEKGRRLLMIDVQTSMNVILIKEDVIHMCSVLILLEVEIALHALSATQVMATLDVLVKKSLLFIFIT